jgi:hypothetical protein
MNVPESIEFMAFTMNVVDATMSNCGSSFVTPLIVFRVVRSSMTRSSVCMEV